MNYQYDMIVIGGGAAGLVAAGMSALLGVKTALIEQHRLGGECTWTGCVPSKTLLRVSKAVHQMKTAERFGLPPIDPQFDFSRVMDHVRQTRQTIYRQADAPSNLEKLAVDVIRGSARFCDPHTIEIVDSAMTRRITSRYFVIATGSRPKTADFSKRALTNETIFELKSQPKRLLVMGAGPVGIEMAQAFCRLGSEVTVVSDSKRILPRDDPEQAGQLQDYLSEEGVSFVFRQKVVALEERENGLNALLENGHMLPCDAALAAMGREPFIEDLRLNDAGVRYGVEGITVDDHARTSQHHIYAAGDVTGRYRFTHMAEHMSKVAVTNAILRWPQKLDQSHVVWVTYTDPELAHLAASEQQLRQSRKKYTTYRFPFTSLDRAITDGDTRGEVKVFADRSGRILGASIFGAHAGEMISEFALAMRNNLRLSQVASTIHPYPTYSLANRRVADLFVAKQLDSPLLGILGRILRYRGQRRGSSMLE
ncbi:MAG TPA: FAD-dependent oxidoreductase [Bryobacteraceae bacterium]|jgi:pyruvate/2-oxoglutarate dehydrogenase complex dihydrolipoamide dehydrogenase (E3) component|nr:FAD-dependent oxidoreductase [Bryobacteraceae bacterium]